MEAVFLLDGVLECGVEDQDRVARRWLREVDVGQRGLGGIAAVQCLVQVTHMIRVLVKRSNGVHLGLKIGLKFSRN